MSKLISMLWNLIEAIALFFLRILCKIFHKEMTGGVQDAFLQFVRFGIVGASSTFVNYGLYIVWLLTLRALNLIASDDLELLVANTGAWAMSVLWSFFWNNRYVFTMKEGEHRSWWRALLKSYCSYAFTGVFLSNVLLIVWTKGFGISEFIAHFINLMFSIPINFLMNKFWAYRTKKD